MPDSFSWTTQPLSNQRLPPIITSKVESLPSKILRKRSLFQHEFQNRRHLYETYNNPTSMSNKCNIDCISDSFNFCPNSSYSGGYCCDPTDPVECPRANICSEDNPRAPILFKLAVCPNESACGSKNIYPNYNGDHLIREVEKY
jgi:hypothetical protein